MNREYDIFESFPNGPIWRCSVVGREEAISKMLELAKCATYELFVMYTPEREVIARVNTGVNDMARQQSAGAGGSSSRTDC